MLALAQRAIETGDEAAAERWLTRVRPRIGAAAGDGIDTLVREFQRKFGRAPR